MSLVTKYSSLQLSKIALMEHFVWLMDPWRVQAEWRSASMVCGEQCVIVVVTGIMMMPELCVDNWATVGTLEEVSSFIHWGRGFVMQLGLKCYQYVAKVPQDE